MTKVMVLSDDTDPPLAPQDARNLAFLRRLVTVLTATMILGVLTIVVLLVIRLQTPPRTIPIPAQIALPEGTRVIAITQTADRLLVVTEEDNLLVFDASGTMLERRIPLSE